MNIRLKEAWKKNPANISIIVSIVLHLLFFATFEEWSNATEWVPVQKPLELYKENQPVKVTLAENPNARKNDAPDDDQSKLLSDRNGRARDNLQTDLPQGNLPYNESPVNADLMQASPQTGQTNLIPPQQPANESQPQQPANESQEETEEETGDEEREHKKEQESKEALADQIITPSRRKFSRQLLSAEQSTPTGASYSGLLSYDNRKFDAKELGDFSLNTYNWEFAPYLLELKRRIQRNIFPPPAFTIMGMIQGEYIVRFSILPDGKLESVEVLASNGHESLERTSVKAIELSAPFMPLPENFPEDKLIITGRFTYHILDQDGQPMHRQ